MNKIYRSNTNKIIAGVCGGIADYLNINPKIVRLGFLLGMLLPFFPSTIIYACLWILLNPNPIKFDKQDNTSVIDATVIDKKSSTTEQTQNEE